MDIVYYTVRPGNTLFGIAQFFQTTVNDILRYNNIADANRIYVGETLAIPAGTSQSPRTHIVRPGESLWYISKMYNMTVDDLMNKNNLGNPNVLYLGQILNV